jgi:hypothetical protein
MDLTDVYRVLHPGIAQYIFLSNPWNFLQIRTYLGMQHKSQQIKKMEIIPCILFGHNGIKWELTNKSSSRKYWNNWRLNNTLLNDQWVTEQIRRNTKSS